MMPPFIFPPSLGKRLRCVFTAAVMNGPWVSRGQHGLESVRRLCSPLLTWLLLVLCASMQSLVPPTPKPIPEDRARPMALCQVAAHLDSLTENDADASCWRCHLITAIRPFSSAAAVISYLWAALEGVWTKNPLKQRIQAPVRDRLGLEKLS